MDSCFRRNDRKRFCDMRFFIIILVIISILALSATIGALIVGMRSFEGLVVEKPYETGLAWDELQKQKKENLGKTSAAAAENRTACDIQAGPCRRQTADGIIVDFEVQPRPVTSMSGLNFVVTLTKNGMPLKDASVLLDLSMPGMH